MVSELLWEVMWYVRYLLLWTTCSHSESSALVEIDVSLMSFSSNVQACMQVCADMIISSCGCITVVQWNLRIKDTLGAEVLSSFRRLSSGGRFEPIGHL